jgi:hypothetical protein
MSGGLEPFPIDDARAGRTQTVALWKQAGGQVDAPFTFEDWAPLQLFAAEGCLPGVSTLLECGARPEGRAAAAASSLAGVPLHSPLHLAARYGHAPVCAALCSQGGAWADAKDSHGFAPLHYAALHGHRAAAQALLAAGADPRLRSTTAAATTAVPAGGASSRGSASGSGGDGRGESSSGGGYTPAEVARAAGHVDLAALLEGAAGDATKGSDNGKLRAWLDELGCGAYFAQFLAAGYDFGFVHLHGLDKDDVDAIGVPLDKMGLRKKLMAKYKFPKDTDDDRAAAEESDEHEDESGPGSAGSDDEGSGSEGESGSDEEF